MTIMNNPVAGFFVYIFGSVFASFFGVVISRVPRGESIVFPGSHCFDCGRELTWKENIPIVSWLVSGGKCRSCGAKIGVFSFVYEILGGLFPTLTYVFSDTLSEFILKVIFTEVVFLVCGYDWENHRWLGRWSAAIGIVLYACLVWFI